VHFPFPSPFSSSFSSSFSPALSRSLELLHGDHVAGLDVLLILSDRVLEVIERHLVLNDNRALRFTVSVLLHCLATVG
jgi:hypothetical protein